MSDAGPYVLPAFHWQDHTREVADAYWKLYGLPKAQPFLAAHHEQELQLRYLNIIWQRLQQHYKTIGKLQEKTWKRLSKKNEDKDDSNAFQQEHYEKQNAIDLLNLDLDSFFIHGYMLMDRIARMAQLITSVKAKKSISDIFSHQITQARNSKEIFEELGHTGYLQLVLSCAEWFEKLLKTPRDKLIVHSRSLSAQVGIGKGIYAQRVGHDRRILAERNRLDKLRNKYGAQYPELLEIDVKRVTDLSLLLGLLKKNESMLNVEEKEYLDSKFGGTLPDVLEVASKLTSFTQDFTAYFLGRLRNSTQE